MDDRTSKASRFIPAEPEAVYRAFTDPQALAEWMPPGEMTGEIGAFDLRAGGDKRSLAPLETYIVRQLP